METGEHRMKPPNHVSPRIRWLSAVAVTLVILACGGPPRHITPLPQTTLPPETAPFSVVTLAGGLVQARAGRDGALLWQHQFTDSSHHTLVASDGVVYHRARTTQDITALHADTGASLWQFPTCGGYDDGITVANRIVYTTCGTSQLPPGAQTIGGDEVYALDARTGVVRWKAARSHFRAIGAGLAIVQTPTGIAAHDAVTGALLWTHDVAIAHDDSSVSPPRDPYTFTVTVANGAVYYSPSGEYGEYFEAVNAHDGRLLWQSPILAESILPSSDERYQLVFQSTFTVALVTSSVMIVRGMYAVLGLNVSDGSVRWHYDYIVAGERLSSVVGDDGTTYIVSFFTPDVQSRQMTALNPEDGSVRWKSSFPALSDSQMWLAGSVLLISGSTDLWEYDTNGGRILWHDEAILPYGTPEALAVTSLVACITAPDSTSNITRLLLLTVPDGKQVWMQNRLGILDTPPLLLPGP